MGFLGASGDGRRIAILGHWHEGGLPDEFYVVQVTGKMVPPFTSPVKAGFRGEGGEITLGQVEV